MDRAWLSALIDASRQSGIDLSIQELRDLVYLAAHIGPATSTARAAAGPDPAQGRSPVTANGPPAPGAGAAADVDAGPAGSRPTVPIVAYETARSRDAGMLPIRMPAAPVLGRARFAKALRYLKRGVDSRVEFGVDAEATARQAADTGLWQPVLVPAVDRWLCLAVVIDDAASGPGWAPEVRELLRAFEESGAFSGIQVWRFDSDDPADGPLTIRGGGLGAVAGRDSKEIINPTGRRAVLVLSDCVGAGWGDGRVGRMIGEWAGTNPVAILHLLPQRLWGRCRAHLTPVEWRARRPYVVGQRSEWRECVPPPESYLAEGTGATRPSGFMVPVLDLTPGAIAGWAMLIAGAVPRRLRGVAFDTAHRVPAKPADAGTLGPADEGDSAALQVARFRAVASPKAWRLATALSAAPLQPPVIRMVQRTMLGDERSTYWAEILLSGLVCRVTEAGGGERRTFDFVDGVREHLLTGLTRRESLDLLHASSEFVSSRLGGTLDFLTLMTVDQTTGSTPADLPLARVAVQVLRSLGGVYADKAQEISTRLAADAGGQGSSAIAAAIGTETPLSGVMARNGDPVTSTNTSEPSTSGDGRRDTSRATIWDVPQRTQHFTGREVLLDDLRQDLIHNPNRAAVLVPRALFGLGGVGKTALANEYAHKFRADYDVVWWIPAEDSADIRRSLVDLSRALRLPENTDQAETIRTLLRALHDGYPKARWLLVYDNATSPDRVRELLPTPKRHGHVLITSRDRAWGDHGALLEVDVFTRPESTTLLRRRAAQLTEDDADRLARLLEDLPLALHQAAAWHAETELPVAEYRRRYDEMLGLLAEVALPPEYPRPVGAAFGVSYEQLQARSEAAAQLLQLCSYFGPEPIYVEMLYRARNMPGLPQPLRRQMADRSTIGRELREIARYELIKFDQARGRFQLHRLVQSVLRSTLTDAQRQTNPRHAHDILALANPGNPDELGLPDLVRHAQLSPHILPSGIVESADEEARRVVLDQIRYRYVVGDYEGSRDLAESTVAHWRHQHGDRDRLLLHARSYLGTTLRALGHPAQSLRIDEEVLALLRQTVGEDDDLFLVTANGFAADLRALGRFREALEFDRALLAQHRRVLRDDDPATLRTAGNYAVDLRLMGEFGEARDLDTASVRHWTDGYGSDHHETLHVISNLVRDFYGLGRYGEALTVQQEAIVTQEAAVGATHLSVLSARRAIAVLLRKLGRYQEARRRAEENHAAHVARLPEHHELTLAATMSLCNALRDEHKDLSSLWRARELADGALQLYERYYNEPPFVEVCRTNLAILMRRLGEVARATELNAEAVERLRANLGAHHPYTLCSSTNLASDLAAAGDYAGACEISTRVYEFSADEAIRGIDHPYTLGCALNYSLDLQGAGRLNEGESLWRETVARFDRILGADHPDSIAARNRQRIDADIEPPPT